MDEFGLIDHFLKSFVDAGGSLSGGAVLLGPGDDTALVQSAQPLAVTVDALVEGVHFRRDWATWEQVGHKALAVNLSDLAAMGAQPVAFLCALAVPPHLPESALLAIAQGMAPLAREQGAILCGGNITRADQLSITITALGRLNGAAVLRLGARPGDALLLCGRLGEAAAELRLLMKGLSIPSSPIPSALHMPQPLCALGAAAADRVHAGIDISDGLYQDLGHIASASNVKLVVEVAALPMSPRFHELTTGLSAAEQASLLLSGGEDYALVWCGPDALATELGARTIGRVEALSSGEKPGVHVNGAPAGTRLAGHDHLRATT